MPNHVKNVWTIKNLSKSEIVNVLEICTIAEEDRGAYPLNCVFDFNKIIPEPTRVKDCPEDCILSDSSYGEDLVSKPWFDWYRWRMKYWGTKWNPYDSYIKIGKDYVTFVFSTAWSFAEPVARGLERLNHDIEINFADEDLGFNCGKLIYTASEREWQEEELKNSIQFARRLWKKY